MRKMVVAVPDDVFKALKLHAVQNDRTMKALVEAALRHYLGLKKGGEEQ